MFEMQVIYSTMLGRLLHAMMPNDLTWTASSNVKELSGRSSLSHKLYKHKGGFSEHSQRVLHC